MVCLRYLQGIEAAETKLRGCGCSTLFVLLYVFFELGGCLPVKKMVITKETT